MINQFFKYIVTGILLAGVSSNVYAIAEDPYEVNNTQSTATDLSAYPANWLSTLAGQGASLDEDWYMITVSPGINRVQLDLRFFNSDSDLDLALFDSSGLLLVDSTSATDNEYIEYDVDPGGGFYYIRVVTYTGGAGSYNGTAYDLWWNSITPVDDIFEENDDFASAYDHTGNETLWLSDISGSGGIASDFDVYQIDVTAGYTRVQVELLYTHSEGDLGVHLYDSAFISVVFANTATDNESIDYEVPAAGTYYIVVYNNSGYTGQSYDLWWDDLQPTVVATDDAYEENDDITTAYSLAANTLLSNISGSAVAADPDIYQITVSSGSTRVQADLQFLHAEGDLDLQLLDSTGGLVTESTGVVDNESIDYDVLSPGTYYLSVIDGSGTGFTGQNYDLQWNGVQANVSTTDDLAEPNNNAASAFAFSSTSTWLSDSTGGFVTSSDEDWYQITVPANQTQLYVYLEYVFADGDIDITLYNSSQQIVSSGDTTATVDNDEISFQVSSGGTYYLRVYNSGSYTGQNYNMWWGVTTPTTTIANDDAYEVNNNAASAYQLSLTSSSLQGISADDDWYKIVVPADKKHIIADLLFTHGVNNDLDLYLFDSDGTTILAGSFTADDNENIEFTVPASGAYYLQVVTWTGDGDSYAGATYELRYSVIDPNNATGNTTTTTNTKGGILTGGGGGGGGGGGSLSLTSLLLLLLPGLLRRRIDS